MIWFNSPFSMCFRPIALGFVLNVLLAPNCNAQDSESTKSPTTLQSESLDEPGPASGKSKRILVEKDVIFNEPSEPPLRADVYRPNNDRVYPLVVLIHGGAWVTGDKWNFADHARQLADEGFVVASINYRLAPAHKYPAQLIDCRQATRWFADNADRWNADSSRLALWGYSAGAQLAAMLALESDLESPAISCCVVGGLPSDLTAIPPESGLLKGVFGATRKENPQIYADASPTYHVRSEAPPMLIYHGHSDLMVPFQPAKAFHEKLLEVGCRSTFYTIEKSGHLLAFMSMDGRREVMRFLKEQLKENPK